ncbi:protein phosphatase 1 regulatory subunit 1B-like isoform X2 [Takifugu flavidus]|uniref:Protein phosphatase 1 regulatory subunit 1B n=1 Tax=Takifugu flavidus TaxID=433684 RepID=A0A5C6PQW6_9TELE|nr:protein phosphatase 1 regulatory subunit 1B-like isoform X2 [Takifugu flavidus]TWW81893.1 Protein phosphatase 1 regulatory subunit 1B DARPP-32 [Takifugu flavidus]
MNPLLPPEMDQEADADTRRKIQFSVPSPLATQLDPRQVEMIRRRRPTPATLFRLSDPPSPVEDNGPHQWVFGENGVLKTKLSTSTYEPPSLKDVQRMAQAHLSSLDMPSVDKEDLSSGGEEEEMSQKRASDIDSSKDRKLLGNQHAPVDNLTEKADLSCHQLDGKDAKGREEEETGE